MGFERARNDEQKNIRIKQITDSARHLFENNKYENITLSGIARELSFTRANLYKYVASKEEVFLYIIIEDIAKWNDDIVNRFKESVEITKEKFARIWTQSFIDHSHMIKAMSIMYSVIEKNVTVEKLTDFKISFFKEMEKSTNILLKLFPELQLPQIHKFLEMQMFYAIGLYPATIENAIQKKAIEKAGIPYDPPNFSERFSDFIIMLLNNLQNGLID